MEIERARYLVSATGREALAVAAAKDLPSGHLARVEALRRELPPGEASALAEQLALRERAETRFGVGPPHWLWTPAGLEMATHPLVAGRRAQRIQRLGRTTLDLTCGLGNDLDAVARAGIEAVGLDVDPVTALLARANLRGAAEVARGDARQPPFQLRERVVLLDPGRRPGGTRSFDPEAFEPPWEACLAIAGTAAAAVIKSPPGIQDRWLPAESEVEFVQMGRSLREATVWLGEGAVAGLRRAVLLPEGVELDSRAPECDAEPVPPRRYILDPAACVTRAGLVRHLAAAIHARLADPHIAYLWSDDPVATPLAAAFEVLDVVEFSVARLRRRLRERRWRPAEIRRRAFPIEPDELRRLIGRIDGDPVSLLCTTIAGKRLVVVCRSVPAGDG